MNFELCRKCKHLYPLYAWRLSEIQIACNLTMNIMDSELIIASMDAPPGLTCGENSTTVLKTVQKAKIEDLRMDKNFHVPERCPFHLEHVLMAKTDVES